MFRIAWVFGSLLVLLGFVSLSAPEPAVRADDRPFDVKRLGRRLHRAVLDRGTDLAGLARLCDRKDYRGWAALLRARAMIIRPHDTKLRKELGYVRERKTWIWPDAAREEFRKLDPGGLREPKDLRKARIEKRKRGIQRFLAVAAEAERVPAHARQEVRDEAASIRRLAWERIREIDPLHEEACRQLGFIEFQGQLIRPEAKPFLEARARRAKAARDILDTPVQVKGIKKKGKVARAEGGGMRVDGMYTVRDLERLARAMIHAHIAFADALRLGEPEAVEKGLTFVILDATHKQYLDSLRHYGGMSAAEAADVARNWSAWWVKSRTVVMRKSSLEEAIELATAYMCRGGARRRRKLLLDTTPKEAQRNEPWLYDAISMDVTIRMTGKYTQSISSGQGTTGQRDLKGASSWLGRARLLVEMDDDPQMRGIVQREMNSLRMRETAKGYAFLQYLFERNSLKASQFFHKAMVEGGEAAAAFVYGESLPELEVGYRNWILLTVEPAGSK